MKVFIVGVGAASIRPLGVATSLAGVKRHAMACLADDEALPHGRLSADDKIVVLEAPVMDDAIDSAHTPTIVAVVSTIEEIEALQLAAV